MLFVENAKDKKLKFAFPYPCLWHGRLWSFGSHGTMVSGHKGKGEGVKSTQAWWPQPRRKQEKGRVVSPVGWQASAACLAMGGLWLARAVMERRRARRKRMAEGDGQSADGEGQDMLLALQSCLWLERQHGSRGALPPSSSIAESILPVPSRAPPAAQPSLNHGKWGQAGPPSSCCWSHTGPTDCGRVPGQRPAAAAGLGAAAEGVVSPWQNLPEGSVRLGVMSPLLGSTGGTEWIWGGSCLVPPISGLGRNKLSLREASRAPVGLRPSLLRSSGGVELRSYSRVSKSRPSAVCQHGQIPPLPLAG